MSYGLMLAYKIKLRSSMLTSNLGRNRYLIG